MCDDFYKQDAAVTPTDLYEIGQSDNSIWVMQRHLRLTSSNFGRIARRRNTIPVASRVKALLYRKPFDIKATRWGQEHEQDAEDRYIDYLPKIEPALVLLSINAHIHLPVVVPWMVSV